MKRGTLILVLSLVTFPLALRAQQTGSASSLNPSSLNPASLNPGSLNDQQKLGRRVFEQRCAVCHTLVGPSGRTYGPFLYKDLIAGSEDSIREFIKNGSPGKMPGFKYGMEPSEINAIVEYLKTVSKPKPSDKTAGGEDRTD